MNHVVEQLAEQFGVSTEFAQRILGDKGLLERSAQSADADAFATDIGGQWKFVSYALGTNQRAKSSLDKMFALGAPDRTGSALDIGCGYGGFMKAFADRGFKAHGVEIDARLAELSRLNLGAAATQESVQVGDLFTGALDLGKFDLITVNDVIEHLGDPLGAFNRLASMLNPGGMLGIYAPNGRSIFYAASDPHNRVFGASVLPGPLAAVYGSKMLNASGYGLGEYMGLEEFEDLCRRNGLSFGYRSHDGGERPEGAMDYLARFAAAFQASEFRAKVPALVARSVERAVWDYVGHYSSAAERAVQGTGYDHFTDTYLARAWTIVCKKGGKP